MQHQPSGGSLEMPRRMKHVAPTLLPSKLMRFIDPKLIPGLVLLPVVDIVFADNNKRFRVGFQRFCFACAMNCVFSLLGNYRDKDNVPCLHRDEKNQRRSPKFKRKGSKNHLGARFDHFRGNQPQDGFFLPREDLPLKQLKDDCL